MPEQPDDANRRVVKKVVKKTVLRPVAPTVPRKAGAPVTRSGDQTTSSTPAAPTAPAAPHQRPTRLTTPARVQASRAAAPVSPVESAPAPVTPIRRPAGAPKATLTETVEPESAPAEAKVAPVQPVAPVETEAPAPAVSTNSTAPAPVEMFRTPQPKTPKAKKPPKARKLPKAEKPPKAKKERQPRRKPSMPSIALPALPRPDVRGGVANVWHAIVHGIGAFFGGIGRRIAGAWRRVVGLRLPHLSPSRGSAITGVVVGLMAVAMGWGFYQLFAATLGTQAGGGWGFLAFTFLSFVVFLVGEMMLTGFGIEYPRIISILAVLLVLLVILVFFIQLVAGIWAWLIVPVLCAAMFMLSSFTVLTVSQEKNDQRLPWEPTDESQVNRG